MEKYFTIPTPDGFEINGVLNCKEKSERLIIFCHGLTGYIDEAHYVCGKNFFIEYWYEVLRFNFYDDGEKNRKLASCSLENHASDIETILKSFSDNYSEVILIGHSLWAPSIIRVENYLGRVSKIIFWDPAFDYLHMDRKFLDIWGIKLFRWIGRYIQVSEKMISGRKENHLSLLETFSFPKKDIKIIFAGGNNKTEFKAQTDVVWIESHNILWANHNFDEEWKEEELFEKTLEFIEK